MGHDFPLFGVQRTASGQWSVRALSDDPLLPAVLVVDVVNELERPHLSPRKKDLRTMTRSDWSGEPWRDWYGSGRWKRLRARQLKDHPLCVLCLGRGVVTVATVADHIVRQAAVALYRVSRRNQRARLRQGCWHRWLADRSKTSLLSERQVGGRGIPGGLVSRRRASVMLCER